MKKKNIIILLLLTILTTLYFYLYAIFTYDAVWNYGFAYNITKGLVPYRDYNMIITPLFPYLLSLFILIFGHKLILYYLFMAILTVLITYFYYKKIGLKAITIYLILLATHDLGYNVLALFLFTLLLTIIDKKNNDITIAIIISLLILTKQTLGILIIPSIIYSKNKKKTTLVYITTFLLLLIYLLINNSLYQFIDYCFLGMFDFTSNNSTNFTLVTFGEIIICICIIIGLIRSKFINKELLYILLFQIIVFPIVDGVHFIITFIPVLYYIYYRVNYKYANYLIYLTISSFFIVFNILQSNYTLDTIYNNKKSFMYGKRIQNYLTDYFKYIYKYKEKYKNYNLYIIDSRAYLVKLELDIKINKYDLINNGNMGYKGSRKYIKEINKKCTTKKCIFFVSGDKEIKQINKDIPKYISKKYKQINSSNLDNIYIN